MPNLLENVITDFDVVIVGGGPGGLSAAVYATRANLKTVILERGTLGGQLQNTDEVENYPSQLDVHGPELADYFINHAQAFGADTRTENVTKIERLENGQFLVHTRKALYQTPVVILSTGTTYNTLNVPGEAEFTGRGVSYCAICDGGFYKEKSIAVVGGGNSAVEEALYLSQFAKDIRLLVRGERLTAERILINRLTNEPSITPIYHSVVDEIIGEGEGFKAHVSSLRLTNTVTGEHYTEQGVDGVFIYIGMTPNSQLVRDFDICDKFGFVKTTNRMETAIPGLFAVGDVRSGTMRQVITASADGSIAGQAAYDYIEHQLSK